MISLLIQHVVLPLCGITAMFLALFGLKFWQSAPATTENPSKNSKQIADPKAFKAGIEELRSAILWLKNGNAVSGIVVSSQNGAVTLNWRDGNVTIPKRDIKSIEWGKTIPEPQDQSAGAHEILKWPWKNNPVIRLHNQNVIDGFITEVKETYIVVREDLKKNSYIEYQISKDRMEAIEFNIFDKLSSRDTQARLLTSFPKLGEYEGQIRFGAIASPGIAAAAGKQLDAIKSRMPAAQQLLQRIANSLKI